MASSGCKRTGLLSSTLKVSHAEHFQVHMFLCRSAAWHGIIQGGFLLQETVGKPPFGLYLRSPLHHRHKANCMHTWQCSWIAY